jgi:drug/metabolite transporter (DMT)-like permease
MENFTSLHWALLINGVVIIIASYFIITSALKQSTKWKLVLLTVFFPLIGILVFSLLRGELKKSGVNNSN